MMVELTSGAMSCLNEYLAEVRSSLRHCRSVRVDEVENDVREHVEHALSGAAVEVDVDELREVLTRLGKPSQWVPQDELNGFQRALLALRCGPEDLRLGYLAFGTLVFVLLGAAVLNSVFGFGTTFPFLVVGIAVSFCLARASLAAITSPTRVERWLIYPSLVIVYVPITAILLFSPVVFAMIMEAMLADRGGPSALAWAREYPLGTITVFTIGIAGSVWWAILALIAYRWPGAVRDCYFPLAGDFRRDRRLLVVAAVLILIALSCGTTVASELKGKTPYF
jgi:hypothetical protein